MAYSYWYAIVEASGADLAVPTWGNGLLESPLRLVIEDDLAAVVSDWPKPAMKRSSDAVDPQLVWQHEGVIERIMASQPVLPVRFGTILADDERIQRLISDAHKRALQILSEHRPLLDKVAATLVEVETIEGVSDSGEIRDL